jgi:hypothetical protein
MKKIDWGRISNVEKSSCNFRWKQKPNCTLFYPQLKRQCRFKIKLNYYLMNIHKKIKPKDLIRFLIGQFDLIICQIKV